METQMSGLEAIALAGVIFAGVIGVIVAVSAGKRQVRAKFDTSGAELEASVEDDTGKHTH